MKHFFSHPHPFKNWFLAAAVFLSQSGYAVDKLAKANQSCSSSHWSFDGNIEEFCKRSAKEALVKKQPLDAEEGDESLFHLFYLLDRRAALEAFDSPSLEGAIVEAKVTNATKETAKHNSSVGSSPSDGSRPLVAKAGSLPRQLEGSLSKSSPQPAIAIVKEEKELVPIEDVAIGPTEGQAISSNAKEEQGKHIGSRHSFPLGIENIVVALPAEEEEETKALAAPAVLLAQEKQLSPPLLSQQKIAPQESNVVVPPSSPNATANQTAAEGDVAPLTKTIISPTTIPLSETKKELPKLADNSKGFVINFNNVKIIEYIRFISKLTGKNFIFDETELQFSVTIVSEEPATIDNIMAALLQELRIHGLSLMEQGNNLIIHTNPAVNTLGSVVGTQEKKTASDIETRVFSLATIDPKKAAEIIKPLLSAQSLAEPVEETNDLVVTDITANVEKVAQLIKNLDSTTGGYEIGQYLVQNAVPDSLIALAEKILSPLAQGKQLVLVGHAPTNSIFIVAPSLLVKHAIAVLHNLDVVEGRTRVLPLEGPAEEMLFSPPSAIPPLPGQEGIELAPLPPPTAISPEEEATPQAIEQARIEEARRRGELIAPEVLTRPSRWANDLPYGHPQNTQFYVHKVQYRKGEQIEKALRKIAENLQQTGVTNLDLVLSINSIQWIESSNSLIFTGTRDAIQKIKELIEEIDTPLRQVFIEMLILDTSIADSLTFSVDSLAEFGTPSAAGAESMLSSNSPLVTEFPNLGISGPGTLDASGLAQNAGFNIGVIGRHLTQGGISFNSIGALVEALHSKSDDDIILNPKMLVEDNSASEIFVGINAPFKTQSIVNDIGSVITNNVEFRDIGVKIKVIPYLGNNEIVTLEVEQEISTIATNQGTSSISGVTPANLVNALSLGPVTKKSKSSTRVHVPDRYFVILSGIIQDEDFRSRNQVPCLGAVPVLGSAFSNKQTSVNKRNLMLFLWVCIVDSDSQFDEITKRQQDIFSEKSRLKNSWKYEVDESLDFLNLESTDPKDVDCP